MRSNNLKYIKLQVEIPKSIWIYSLSKKFSDQIITLNYSTSLSTTERQVFLSTISKKKIDEIYEYLIKNTKGQVKDLEIFGSNIKLVFKLNFLQKIFHHKLTIIFPVVIHDGYATIEIFANKNQIELLDKFFSKIKILKIADDLDKKEDLTIRQKQILETAYMLGYFSYPRKISLTELAKHLKISKATLSENLRVAENKIISNYFLNKF